MQAEDFIRKMAGLRLLVVGDVMLDVYEEATEKESHEQFSPVYSVTKQTFYPGGAANVAYIADELGATVRLCGVLGKDKDGFDAYRMICSDGIAQESDRWTTVKTRVFVDGVPRVRRDIETTRTLLPSTAERLIHYMGPQQPGSYDAVLFSDYDKGVLRTPGVIEAAMALAPLRVLDPKRYWAPFAGVQYATPNAKEARGESLLTALKELPGASIIETRGHQGAQIHSHISLDTCHSLAVPTIEAREVDAVGAGDAFATAFTLAKAAGANDAQAVVVGQGVARWWVIHERGAILSIPEIENQIAIVEDAQ